MVRNLWPFYVLTAVLVSAQVKSGAPSVVAQSADDKPATSMGNVQPEAPVLTIKGLCSQAGATPKVGADPACTTVITRAQFDRLVTVLRADKDPEVRRQLSTAYPQILVLAHEAEARGLDKQPDVMERLNFARLQILSRELVDQIRDQAAQVPEKDIDDYYKQNISQYEQVSVERLIIPLRVQPKPGGQTAADSGEKAMDKLAESLHAQAVAGGDFAKMQKEAYDAAGLSGNSDPNPRMDRLRRRGLPPAHVSVFDLKPGEVSPVITDMTGHYIYKMDSKETLPVDAVTTEITNILRRQRTENMIHQVEQPFTTDVNHAYFRPEPKADRD